VGEDVGVVSFNRPDRHDALSDDAFGAGHAALRGWGTGSAS
jgi:hypothetical protein